MALTYAEYPDTRTVEFTVSGFVSNDDYQSVFGSLEGFIASHGNAKLIEVTRRLDGLEASLLRPDAPPAGWSLPKVSHVAVVSDIGWFSPVIRVAGAQAGTRLRLFALHELDKARAWLAEPFSRG